MLAPSRTLLNKHISVAFMMLIHEKHFQLRPHRRKSRTRNNWLKSWSRALFSMQIPTPTRHRPWQLHPGRCTEVDASVATESARWPRRHHPTCPVSVPPGGLRPLPPSPGTDRSLPPRSTQSPPRQDPEEDTPWVRVGGWALGLGSVTTRYQGRDLSTPRGLLPRKGPIRPWPNCSAR